MRWRSCCWACPPIPASPRLDNPQHLRTHSYNFFANDTWRVRPNLTLTLGLRYEYNSPAVDAQNRANLYDPATQTLVPGGHERHAARRLPPGSQQFRAARGPGLDAARRCPARWCARATASTTTSRRWRPARACTSARPTSISTCTIRSAPRPRCCSAIRFPAISRCPRRPRRWPSSATCARLTCSSGTSISSAPWAAAAWSRSATSDRRAPG